MSRNCDSAGPTNVICSTDVQPSLSPFLSNPSTAVVSVDALYDDVSTSLYDAKYESDVPVDHGNDHSGSHVDMVGRDTLSTGEVSSSGLSGQHNSKANTVLTESSVDVWKMEVKDTIVSGSSSLTDLSLLTKLNINATMYVDPGGGFIKFTHKSKLLLPQTIYLTDALFDGGANINVSRGSVANASIAQGSISAWNRSRITSKLIIGERGILEKCLSKKDSKEIVVPGHTRQLLGGSQTWIFNSNLDAHFLVFTPGLSSYLVKDDGVSVVIAVWSAATNYIECCTKALFELLQIEDYTLTGVSYSLSANGNGILCVSGGVIEDEPLEIDAVSHGDHALVNGSFNASHLMIECLFEINHSKFDDRWPANPLTLVTAQMGGWSMSTFVKILRNKTLQGLNWVTNEMIVKAKLANNHSEVIVGLEKFRAPPRNLRFVPGNDTLKVGELWLVDVTYFHRQSGTKSTNFAVRGKWTCCLLAVEYVSLMPVAVPLKDQSTYKKALVKLIDKIIKLTTASNTASKLKYLMFDQHTTQGVDFLEDTLDSFKPDFNITPLYAEVGSQGMSRLNKVSDVLNQMSHFWIRWGSMDLTWFWNSYEHALKVFPLRPHASSGAVRGRGFSPFFCVSWSSDYNRTSSSTSFHLRDSAAVGGWKKRGCGHDSYWI